MLHTPAQHQTAPHAAAAQFALGVECALVPDAIADLAATFRRDEVSTLRDKMVPVLTDIVRELGFDRISSESLIELHDTAHHHSWEYVCNGTPHSGVLARACFAQFMNDGRALFAPVGA